MHRSSIQTCKHSNTPHLLGNANSLAKEQVSTKTINPYYFTNSIKRMVQAMVSSSLHVKYINCCYSNGPISYLIPFL